MKSVVVFNSRKKYGGGLGNIAKTLVFAFISLFSFGFILGLYFDGVGVGQQGKIPLSFLLKAQFYCGDVGDLTEVSKYLPALSESQNDSTLGQWDVSFYTDEVTQANIPTFVRTMETKTGKESATVDLVKAPQKTLALTSLITDTPQVLIYCTHTSEDYAGGGTVLDVAHGLKDDLESIYGIGTVVSDTVHDSPEWYKSYANSRQTAEQMLSQYPDAKLIIDLHRDSGVKKNVSTMEINGKPVAKTLLVVGSNLTMKHPNWEENFATATAVGNCLSAVNGEILRGVRVQKGRYNQHLTKNAILFEVGTNLNTLDEVRGTATVLAEGINNYLATISY
ncbi:MAG: stage II sporulation protein P [Clostridiales bacterium]